MVERLRFETLSAALELGPRELLALVGAGGKTAAMGLLAAEMAARGNRVLVGTTTAMLLAQLAALGTVTRHKDFASLVKQLQMAVVPGRVLAVAAGSDRLSSAGEIKVDGVPPAWVDGLWQEDLLDTFLVEADGGRGKLLKSLGAHEPVLPTQTTTVLLVAGLGIIGAPLTEEHVHRAALLARALSTEEGARLTPHLLMQALGIQLSLLRQRSAGPRIAVFLNQAEQPQDERTGVGIAQGLFAAAAQGVFPWPERIVVGTVRENRFLALMGKG